MDNYYYLDRDESHIPSMASATLPKLKPVNRNVAPPPQIVTSNPPATHVNHSLSPPLQPRLYNEPRQNIPINIPTRGYQTQFSQVGILHNKNKKKGNVILPLYGKQLYPGSSKWQYYVTTDGYNSIKIDIKFKEKSGLGEFGCEEISDRDIVNIPSYRQAFVANIYHLDKPSYIPYIH